MIHINTKGDFSSTEFFFKTISKKSSNILRILEKYGRKGVDALSSVTPIKTGKTASSWEYKITKKNNYFVLSWNNTNVVNGIPIVILLDEGHSTSQGVYIQGKNFINPTIQPIINKISKEIWKEVVGK